MNKIILAVLSAVLLLQSSASSQEKREKRDNQGLGLVKVTFLGSHSGEFCRNDRAILFEDAVSHVRVLYDPGRTTDETDSRLGRVDVILLSHAHTDHIGDTRINSASPGTCAAPATVSSGEFPNIVRIAAAKYSAVFVGGELSDWVAERITALTGNPTPGCAATGVGGNETDVPQASPCTAALRPGGERIVKLQGATQGVSIQAIQAFHSDGIPPGVLPAPGVAPGTSGYGGSEIGFILRFPNGLCVYLTGDTGLFGDMRTIVRDIYQANLVVINMGDLTNLSPQNAAIAINKLLRPETVIPSHSNEASTTSGQPTGYRLKLFESLVGMETRIVLPLSGVSRYFDGDGHCVSCE